MASENSSMQVEEEVDMTVAINDETFTLAKAPPKSSALVVAETKRIVGHLNLDAFVADLGNVGSFARLAYNGVAGYTDLQIRVQRIGWDIAKLTDKSAITIHKFGSTSTSVIENLETTYGFLLEGLDEFAIEILASCSDLAKKMESAARELHQEFEQLANKTSETLEDTQRTKGLEEDKIKKIKKDRTEYQAETEKEEMLRKAAEQKEREYEKYQMEAELRESKLNETINKTRWQAFEVFEAFVPGLKIVANMRKGADTAKAEKREYLQLKHQQNQSKLDANLKLIEFARKLQYLTVEEFDTEVAADALHQAVGGLKHLAVIMNEAALFWNQLVTHCETLSSNEIQNLMEKSSKVSAQQRLKLYTSPVFKKKALRYCAQWVAISSVSDVYMAQIQETRRDLYDYLRENHTIEESRALVKDLARAFQQRLQRAQGDLQERGSEIQDEMRSLEH